MSEATGPETSEAMMNDTEMTFFIQQSRIYDALVAILTHLDRDAALDLLELHSNGDFLGPGPRFSGNFLTDEVNLDEQRENDEE